MITAADARPAGPAARSTDAELLAMWRCGTPGHGDCFSANHLSANRVAWEGQQHARSCRCWQHAVLRAIGWPTVTGQPGSPHTVFEDWSLPHQIMLFTSTTGSIEVSCTCLGPRRNSPRHPREVIEARKLFPADQVILVHRNWHLARGLPVTAKLP
jgi:hypothetical protein